MIQEYTKATAKGVSVGASSTLILAPNAYRVWASIVNDGISDAYLALGEAAVLSQGIYLKASGGVAVFDENMPWKGEISGIASGANNVCVIEVEEVH